MISGQIFGRLGNQMFIYATIRSVAELQGYNYLLEFKNPHERDLIDFFDIDLGKHDGHIQHYYQENSESNQKQRNNDFFKTISDFTHINGYFQTHLSFHPNYKNILKWFENIRDLDNNEVEENLNKYDINYYVYIHFRGTDFNTLGLTAPKYYYDEAQKLFPDKKFLVITDDKDYAIKFFGDNVEVISNNRKTDFELLRCARYLINSNSTFSWWASYLNVNNIKIINPFGGLDPWLHSMREKQNSNIPQLKCAFEGYYRVLDEIDKKYWKPQVLDFDYNFENLIY